MRFYDSSGKIPKARREKLEARGVLADQQTKVARWASSTVLAWGAMRTLILLVAIVCLGVVLVALHLSFVVAMWINIGLAAFVFLDWTAEVRQR